MKKKESIVITVFLGKDVYAINIQTYVKSGTMSSLLSFNIDACWKVIGTLSRYWDINFIRPQWKIEPADSTSFKSTEEMIRTLIATGSSEGPATTLTT